MVVISCLCKTHAWQPESPDVMYVIERLITHTCYSACGVKVNSMPIFLEVKLESVVLGVYTIPHFCCKATTQETIYLNY